MKLLRCFFTSNFMPLLLLLTIVFSVSAFAAVSNLTVSGITTPIAANGTYTYQFEKNGYHVWKHSTETYYIYRDIVYWTWDIDVDTNYVSVLFYASGETPVGATYAADQGTGTTVTVIEAGQPEITVLGNGTSIGDGDNYPTYSCNTKFGSVNLASGTASRTFTIKNDGSVPLSITSVRLTGTDSSDFTKNISGPFTLATSRDTQLTVQFDPSALGMRKATIIIYNNDSDEGTFDFAVGGYGYTPRNFTVSDITNPAANGAYIHQGVLSGREEYWKSSSGSYYIYKVGYFWYIDTDTDTSTSCLFKQYYSVDYLSPDTVGTWTAYGAASGSPHFSAYSSSPEINISGNSVSIASNDTTPDFADTTHFGSVIVSTGSITHAFTIQNTGGTALTLGGSSPYVAISGANASDFTVTTIPASSIASGNSTTFQITFVPTASGARKATATILNNDSDEGTYSFNIKGDGIFPQSLTVSGITTPAAACGNYIYQGILNHFAYWKHTSGSYYIYNSLRYNMSEWDIDADLDCTNGIVYCSYDTCASPADAKTWAYGTGSVGFPVVVSFSPEINVQGNGVSVSDKDVTPSAADSTDFGGARVTGGTVVHTFTVQNTGNGILYLYGTPKVSVSGTNASDFTVTTQPTSPVAATSGSSTFRVSFDPSAAGTRSATLSIVNNDSDEGSYSFGIQGTGLSAVVFADGSNLTQTIIADSTNQVLGRFRLTADVNGASLSAASIRLNGTRSGLTDLKLWSSADTIFNSGSDTQLGSTVAADPGDGNSAVFSGFSSVIDTLGTYYFVTADVASGGTGVVQGIIVKDSSLTLSVGSLSGTISNAALSSGTTLVPVETADKTVPTKFALNQNYPNPFNPSTTITFSVPERSQVTLKVYDLLGKEVATLANGIKSAQTYTVTFNAANLPSGVYFYKLTAGSYSSVKKLLLLK